MSNSYDYNQSDPVMEATEAIQYQDTDTAREALRRAIHSEASRLLGHNRIAQEHQKSMRSLAKFHEQNEAFHDPMVQAAAKAAMIGEQYSDLVNSGFLDPDKFKEAYGRGPSENEICNWHLTQRAAGRQGLRSSDQLLDDVAKTVEGKFGIRRRITDVDQNRSRAAREMVNRNRQLRGLEPEEYPEAPRPRIERDQPATEDALRNLTLAGFGLQNEAEAERADAERQAKRRDVIAGMQRGRVPSRAEGDARVQVSRTADDSRFARQAG